MQACPGLGDLVLRVSRRAEPVPRALVHVGLLVGIKADPALRKLDPERRVLLEGEAVRGDVVRAEGEGLVDVAVPFLLRLPGQCEHQVDVHAREVRGPDPFVGAVGLLAGVRAAERLEEGGPEALYPEGNARDPHRPQGGQPGGGHGGGSELHRPLRGRAAARQGVDHSAKALQVTRREEAGGPAPKEHRRQRAIPGDERGLAGRAFYETIDRIPGRRNLVESAEVARAGAEGNVDIEAEGLSYRTFGLLHCGDSPH
jgi:hypothetical protein